LQPSNCLSAASGAGAGDIRDIVQIKVGQKFCPHDGRVEHVDKLTGPMDALLSFTPPSADNFVTSGFIVKTPASFYTQSLTVAQVGYAQVLANMNSSAPV
jgi:hypothetical protein